MEFDEFLSGYKPTPPPSRPTPHPSDNSHCIVLNVIGSH